MQCNVKRSCKHRLVLLNCAMSIQPTTFNVSSGARSAAAQARPRLSDFVSHAGSPAWAGTSWSAGHTFAIIAAVGGIIFILRSVLSLWCRWWTTWCSYTAKQRVGAGFMIFNLFQKIRQWRWTSELVFSCCILTSWGGYQHIFSGGWSRSPPTISSSHCNLQTGLSITILWQEQLLEKAQTHLFPKGLWTQPAPSLLPLLGCFSTQCLGWRTHRWYLSLVTASAIVNHLRTQVTCGVLCWGLKPLKETRWPLPSCS